MEVIFIDKEKRKKWIKRGFIGISLVLIGCIGFSLTDAKAYTTQRPVWAVILANGNYGGLNEKWKYIDVDLSGGVSITSRPSVPYYSIEDHSGKKHNSIAPAKGTKFLYRESSGNKELKYWVSQGGSVRNIEGGIQSNKKGRIRMENVDATGSTPYIRLPQVSKPGYTFTGWSVTETQLCYNHYNGKYQKFSGSNPGVQKGSDGYYYIKVGAYSNIRTVKPTFKANNFTVRYHANGGSGSMANQTFTYGTTQALRKNTFTRTGYTFLGWKVHRDYDNKWAWAEGTGNGEYWQSGDPGGNWRVYKDGGSIAKTTYSGYCDFYAMWSPNYYYLDLNGLLDGIAGGSISGFGTADIYINGKLVANDVTDFYQQYPAGTTYSITDIKAATGKKYNGLNAGSLSGTITGTVSTRLSFSTQYYNVDLNSTLDGTRVWNLGNFATADIYINGSQVANDVTDFGKTYPYGAKYELRDIKVKPGYTLLNGNISGTITGAVDLNPTFKTNTYTITYKGNGGTWNNTDTWSTSVKYNTSYVTEPNFFTRPGWKFNGWNEKADGSGVDWTAWINKGWTWTRTADVTLYAQWLPIPVINFPDLSHPDNNPIAPFISGNNLVIQQGDMFTPLKYVTATDPVEGEAITAKVKVKSMTLPLDNGRANTTGTFTVTYTVTNNSGVTAEKTINVLVNEPPKITGPNVRHKLVHEEIDDAFLLSQQSANDKEDSNITPKLGVKMIKDEMGNVIDKAEDIDTRYVANYEVIISVTDKYKKTVDKTYTLKIVKDDFKLEESHDTDFRYINKDMMDTLSHDSTFVINTGLNQILTNSLNKQKNQAQKVVNITTQEIQNIKETSKQSVQRGISAIMENVLK